ncbi:cytochrome b/b6 domain-containing protein [soil metagenome]
MQTTTTAQAPAPLIYRHRLPVRIMHWTNVICLTILLMSGLQIFNAHPVLNWGNASRDDNEVLLIGQKRMGNDVRGVTRIAGHEFDTTGVLGVSGGSGRAFPSWITIPGPQWLSMARIWHFFFAWIFVINGFAYVAYTIFSGHLRRDLVPTKREFKGIGQSIKDHIRLRHPHGDDARRYNVLQNLAYLTIIFGVLPLIVFGGWAMSPMMDGFAPGWVDLLGGRQSARTLHFIAAMLLVAFVLVHVFEVIVTGLVNNLRSMITGYWRLPK